MRARQFWCDWEGWVREAILGDGMGNWHTFDEKMSDLGVVLDDRSVPKWCGRERVLMKMDKSPLENILGFFI